ncbi:MAG: hypothetical protein ACXAEU_11585 [Candidatus Hodarchaeales archaeon]|jgi:hypothetical protein
MRRKLFVWTFLIIFMVSFVQPGKSSVTAMEPWGNFYSPVIDETVAGVVDVLFYMNGNSTDILGELFLKYNINSTLFSLYSLYNTTGAGNHSFALDTTSWEDGNYELKLIIYDNFYVTNTTIYSDTFNILNNPIEYTGNFTENIDFTGETSLLIEFEFNVYLSSYYQAVLEIRDDRGTVWNASWNGDLYSGYNWLQFDFWANYLFDLGFNGSSFTFQRLTVYNNSDIVWERWDFGSTQHYYPWDFEASSGDKIRYTGSHNDYIEEWIDQRVLIIEFQFEFYYSSYYHFELEIQDTRGMIWESLDHYENFYNGYYWLKFEFPARYLFVQGFDGSSFNIHRLSIYDESDGGYIAWENGDFGYTRYYDKSEFEVRNYDKLSYTGSRNDWIEDWGDQQVIIIEFQFEINLSSYYHYELEIQDHRGTTWESFNQDEYFNSGYNWLRFDFPAKYLYEQGFDGSSFNIYRLSIYDNDDGNRLVWEIWNFESTRHYDRSEIYKLWYTGNYNDWIEDWGNQLVLIIEFEFEIYYSSYYSFKLDIHDNRGIVWSSSTQEDMYGSNYWVRFEFPAEFILNQGFSGSEFWFQRLSAYDDNLGDTPWDIADFGSTGYYEQWEFDDGGSGDLYSFGVKVGDILTFNIEEFSGNPDAEQVLTRFFLPDPNNEPLIHEGDTVEYNIAEVSDAEVYADALFSGDSWWVKLFPLDSQYGSQPLLLPLEQLDSLSNMIPSEVDYEEYDDGDVIELTYEWNGSSVAMAYYKDSGVMKSLFVNNFIGETGMGYAEIYSLRILGFHEPSDNGGGNGTSSFAFSTPGFELLLVLVAVPVLPYLRKKK